MTRFAALLLVACEAARGPEATPPAARPPVNVAIANDAAMPSDAAAWPATANHLDTSALNDAIGKVQAKIDNLRASGALSTQLATELLATKTRLETAAALQTGNALVIRPATGAAQPPAPARRIAA